MNRFLLIAVVLFSSHYGFSQLGKYEWCDVPTKEVGYLKDANGRSMIPPLRLGTITIKLRPGHRAIVEYNKGAEDQKTFKGKWSGNNNTVVIHVENDTESKQFDLELIELESGVYLRSVKGYSYYIKR